MSLKAKAKLFIAEMMARQMKAMMCTCPMFGYDANCPNHGVSNLLEVEK